MKSPESFVAFNACTNKQEYNSLHVRAMQYNHSDGTLHCPLPPSANDGINNYTVAALMILDREFGRQLIGRDQLNMFLALANEATEKYNALCAAERPEVAMIQNLVGNWNNV